MYCSWFLSEYIMPLPILVELGIESLPPDAHYVHHLVAEFVPIVILPHMPLLNKKRSVERGGNFLVN